LCFWYLILLFWVSLLLCFCLSIDRYILKVKVFLCCLLRWWTVYENELNCSAFGFLMFRFMWEIKFQVFRLGEFVLLTSGVGRLVEPPLHVATSSSPYPA
jgi:hypothetical protein